MPPKLKLENLDEFKVPDLKEHCKKCGLKVSGSKAELIARLKEHLTSKLKNKPEPKASIASENLSETPPIAPSSDPGPTDSNKEEELAEQHPSKSESPGAPIPVSEKAEPTASIASENKLEAPPIAPSSDPGPADSNKEEEQLPSKSESPGDPIVASEKAEPPIDNDVALGASTSESLGTKPSMETDSVSKGSPVKAPDDLKMTEESGIAIHAATQDVSVASAEAQPAIEAEADAHATNIMVDQADQMSVDVVLPAEGSRPAEDGKDNENKAMSEDDECKEKIAEPSEGVTNEIGEMPEPCKETCAVEKSASVGEQQVEEQPAGSMVVEKNLANEKEKSDSPAMDQHLNNEKENGSEPQRDREPEGKQDHDAGSADGPGDSTKENQRSHSNRPKERQSRSPQKQTSSDRPTERQSRSPQKKKPSRKRSPSRSKRSPSRRKRSPSRRRRSPSQKKRRSPSRRRRRSPSRRRKSPSRRRSRSRRRRSPSRRRRSPSRRRRSPSVRRRSSRSRDRRRR